MCLRVCVHSLSHLVLGSGRCCVQAQSLPQLSFFTSLMPQVAQAPCCSFPGQGLPALGILLFLPTPSLPADAGGQQRLSPPSTSRWQPLHSNEPHVSVQVKIQVVGFPLATGRSGHYRD